MNDRMAYVQPSTNIVLIKNCILQKSDNNETDTLYFETRELQTEYFNGLGTEGVTKFTYSPTTYQNISQGVMRIGKTMKQLYGCNYMYFTNSASYTVIDDGVTKNVSTGFEGKRYYCFIDGLKYINNNCTEVYYSIDYIQTFMFDYTEKTCLVDRMVPSDDTLGAYIMDEGLGYGEMEVWKTKAYYFSDWQFLTVYSSKDALPVNQAKIENVDAEAVEKIGVYLDAKAGTSSGQPFMARWFFELKTGTTGFIMNGVLPTVLTIVKGATVYSVKSVEEGGSTTVLNNDGEYFDFTSDTYNYLPDTTDIITGKECFAKLYYGDSVVDPNGYSYSDKAVTDNNMLFSNILNAAAMPAAFSGSSAKPYYYTNDNVLSIVKPKQTVDNVSGLSAFGTYTPKNNKMFTYPYVSLVLSSTEGNSMEYKFEQFSSSTKASFGAVACGLPSPVCNVYPKSYNGNQNVYSPSDTLLSSHKSLEMGIAFTGFPMLPIKVNEYKKYLENNRYRNNLDMVNAYLSVGSSLVDIAGVVAAPTPSGVVSTAEGVVKTIEKFQELAQRQDSAKRIPPSYIGQIGTSDLTMATGQCGYRLTVMRIKEEYARMIDSYFTRYGYRMERHIALSRATRKNRTEFTYIKTIECNISTTNVMAQEDEKAIEDIYNNGIRFWVDPSHYKDYSKTNSLITSSNNNQSNNNSSGNN